MDELTKYKGITKRDFAKIYHNKIAKLNDPDKIVEVVGDNNNSYQPGTFFLQLKLIVRNFINIGFTGKSNEVLLYTFSFFQRNYNKSNWRLGLNLIKKSFVSLILTYMQVVTSKHRDL